LIELQPTFIRAMPSVSPGRKLVGPQTQPQPLSNYWHGWGWDQAFFSQDWGAWSLELSRRT